MSHDPHHDPNSVQLPTPTGWPIVAAFGLTLLFLGLVTSLVISAAGILVGLIGAIGWFTDVFPHPQHEGVPIRPKDEHTQPIRVEGRKVMMLHVGEDSHRMHVPEEIHPYRAGVLGGLVGGVAMAIVACAYGLIAKGSIWFPINLLAAASVPTLAQASTSTLTELSVLGLIIGLVSHVSISILVGLLYVVVLPMLPQKSEWIWGGVIVPLFWSACIFLTLGWISPAWAENISWPWFVASQVVFGLVCGYVVFHSGKVRTIQSLTMSAKLGVEAQHRGDHS